MNFMLQICSGSLPSNQTEIYCHVYESYYCMPVPTYAFEWGACDLISLFPSFSFFFLLFTFVFCYFPLCLCSLSVKTGRSRGAIIPVRFSIDLYCFTTVFATVFRLFCG